MKLKKTAWMTLLAGVLACGSAAAGPVLKATACMFEIQAESLRFARISRELAELPKGDASASRLKAQLKAATQELFLNLHEAQAGLEKAGLQTRYDQLHDQIGDYLAEAITAGADTNLAGLLSKQQKLIKLAEDTRQQIAAKGPSTGLDGMALIGETKVSLERFSYQFEFCEVDCAKTLPTEFKRLESSMARASSGLSKHFKKSNAEAAQNQLVFLKLAVDKRVQQGKPDASSRANVIAASQNLWGVIDTVLDAYNDANP